MKLLLSLVGLVLVLEGLPYIACPELMRAWLKKLSALEPASLRITGLIAVGTGLAICFVARRSGLFG